MHDEFHMPERYALWLNLGFGVLLLAALVEWAIIAVRLARGQPLLRFEPRSPVPWRSWHVAGALLCYMFMMVLAVIGISRTLGPIQDSPDKGKPEVVVVFLAANAIISVVIALAIAAFLRLASGATWYDFGLGLRKVLGDVARGLAAFVAILPVVFGIMLVTNLILRKPHFLVTMLGKHPTSEMMLWAAINAVLVAPISEEFLFRVVLQGWLESVFMPAPHARTPNCAVANLPDESAFAPPNQTDPTNPYASPSQISSSAADLSGDGDSPLEGPGDPARAGGQDSPRGRAALPIIISSGLFAAFHVGHGLDPIPLFAFALVLGYVYQRTHRLWPSVAVHMALNGLSMAQLWLLLRH